MDRESQLGPADNVRRAGEIYMQHFNCAQSVLCAFGDRTGLNNEAALRLAASFGGGMGSLKEVCGALTGAFMVLGLVKGFTDPTRENKARHGERIDRLADAFRGRFGAISCRSLLLRNAADGSDRTEAKPCLKFVTAAAELLAGELARP